MTKYRLQLMDQQCNLSWTEWRDFAQAPTEKHCLGVHFDENVTKDHPDYEAAKQFMKQNFSS